MTTRLDKVHHITTIALVTADLDQEDDWLRDVPNEMEIEDGSSRSMAGKMASRRSAISVSKT
ncbi:hypothetical protein BjapCC829_07220 [Bradyrhizobium barranii]|uniref:Uncharacterized protein n=1 Tax=Bradyrhizobium barranii TaxID=2992140 RepID=A0ABY3QQZ3_9BRAD|nr:hypothetical protein [Bradyrhizobium japonicum]UFW88350.1 hypothetical protein BjapCC829_07220 [Bradyrhizobium japonicum]